MYAPFERARPRNAFDAPLPEDPAPIGLEGAAGTHFLRALHSWSGTEVRQPVANSGAPHLGAGVRHPLSLRGAIRCRFPALEGPLAHCLAARSKPADLRLDDGC